MPSKNVNYDSFGECVKMYRNELGYTQVELANKAGYAIDTIRKFEQNRLRPSDVGVKKLAEVLDVPKEQQTLFWDLSRKILPNIRKQSEKDLLEANSGALEKATESLPPQTENVPFVIKNIKFASTWFTLLANRFFIPQAIAAKKHILKIGWLRVVIIVFILLGAIFFLNQNLFLAGYLFRLVNANKFVKQVTIVANKDWQNSGIYLMKEDTIKIEYVSGSWTADVGSLPYVDANGHDGTIANWLNVSSANMGSLIGTTDRVHRFFVGNSLKITIQNSGFLLLRINDADCDYCLGDNDGSINVNISGF